MQLQISQLCKCNLHCSSLFPSSGWAMGHRNHGVTATMGHHNGRDRVGVVRAMVDRATILVDKLKVDKATILEEKVDRATTQEDKVMVDKATTQVDRVVVDKATTQGDRVVVVRDIIPGIKMMGAVAITREDKEMLNKAEEARGIIQEARGISQDLEDRVTTLEGVTPREYLGPGLDSTRTS